MSQCEGVANENTVESESDVTAEVTGQTFETKTKYNATLSRNQRNFGNIYEIKNEPKMARRWPTISLANRLLLLLQHHQPDADLSGQHFPIDDDHSGRLSS